MNEKRPLIITHDKHFHADDVFSVAALDLYFKGAYDLLRTRDPEVIKTGDIVLDVGGVYDAASDRFDHHQEEGAGMRDAHIPYSSFGIVWKKYGNDVCDSADVAAQVGKTLGAYLDADDNGIETHTKILDVPRYALRTVIKMFRPFLDETETLDEAFVKAVSFAKWVLEKEIRRAKEYIRERDIVLSAYQSTEDKRVLAFDEFLRVSDDVAKECPELLFIVLPRDGQTSWMVRAVQSGTGDFAARKMFPASWRAKSGRAMAEASGVLDAEYCHHSGNFLAVAKTREGAIALARLAASS